VGTARRSPIGRSCLCGLVAGEDEDVGLLDAVGLEELEDEIGEFGWAIVREKTAVLIVPVSLSAIVKSSKSLSVRLARRSGEPAGIFSRRTVIGCPPPAPSLALWIPNVAPVTVNGPVTP
jgi:hypothetical protein